MVRKTKKENDREMLLMFLSLLSKTFHGIDESFNLPKSVNDIWRFTKNSIEFSRGMDLDDWKNVSIKWDADKLFVVKITDFLGDLLIYIFDINATLNEIRESYKLPQVNIAEYAMQQRAERQLWKNRGT